MNKPFRAPRKITSCIFSITNRKLTPRLLSLATMKTFIVQICRNETENGSGPIGLVEEAGSEKSSRFNGFDELCRIMSGSDADRNNSGKKSRKQ